MASSSFFAPRRRSSHDDGDSSKIDTCGQPLSHACGPPKELPPLASGASWKRKIRFLTENRSSWILHVPRFCCSSFQKLHPREKSSLPSFKELWQTHPHQQHSLVLFGRRVQENRYSAMYSKDETVGKYTYSGSSRFCKVCDVSQPHEKFISDLFASVDAIARQLLSPDGQLKQSNIESKEAVADSTNPWSPQHTPTPVYNACLVNWYTPEHTIGLHSDDEPELDTSFPIFSLSWGGPRRFLLRSKLKHKGKTPTVHELLLKDGDLLIMGGKCQHEFKHEIPKVRSTKDGLVGNRISWTIRRMRPKAKAEAVKIQSQVAFDKAYAKPSTKRTHEESREQSRSTATEIPPKTRKKRVVCNPNARPSR